MLLHPSNLFEESFQFDVDQFNPSTYTAPPAYLRLQRYFTSVHPRQIRTRKLWNLENYFLPSKTHLPVIILTAGILFEVIVLLRNFLGKNNKIRGVRHQLLCHETHKFLEAVLFSRWALQLGKHADSQLATERVYELTQTKLC